ncbi:MAG: deoxyribodipyrimidine photo-lyase, partial [Chthoniobacterales bacterium]
MDDAPQVVWFKRDLRVTDHTPLVLAAHHGPVLPLFIIEPEILTAPDFDTLHYQFIRQSLVELRENLRALGQPLVVRTGPAVTVLDNLHRVIRFDTIWSHEETGNHLTYQRDLAVKKWAEIHRIRWHESPQNGVVRRLQSRNGWAKHWEDRIMGAPPLA